MTATAAFKTSAFAFEPCMLILSLRRNLFSTWLALMRRMS